jgi:hypothetical protein
VGAQSQHHTESKLRTHPLWRGGTDCHSMITLKLSNDNHKTFQVRLN